MPNRSQTCEARCSATLVTLVPGLSSSSTAITALRPSARGRTSNQQTLGQPLKPRYSNRSITVGSGDLRLSIVPPFPARRDLQQVGQVTGREVGRLLALAQPDPVDEPVRGNAGQDGQGAVPA